VDESEISAACGLAAVAGMGATSLRAARELYGSFAAAVDAGPAALLDAAVALHLRSQARSYLAQKPDLAALGRWAVAEADRAGAHVVLAGDPAYPALLAESSDAPPVLYVRGALRSEARRVAVVGSREPDVAGADLARRLGEQLAGAGVEVVSGGARGIDSAAHAGALWGGGSTIAVLGCGIDQAYPPENRELFDRIAAGGGAIVSQLTPGTPPSRTSFPRRNRTLAALAHACVVVRAAEGSGALLTADHAAALGRALFAVEGPDGGPLSFGPNALLAAGAARPLRCADDALSHLGWPLSRAVSADTTRYDPLPLADLDVVARSVWEVLDARTPLHVDEVAARAQVAARDALRKLTELELLGLCMQKPGKHFLRSQGFRRTLPGSAGI
jgi:DNA processing protein